jgi:hypothetical protein
MAPVKITNGCSRKAWLAGGCGKYQGLYFKDGDKSRELFFRSSEERGVYYKKHIQGKSRFSSFSRGSVCSSRRPSATQRRCGGPRRNSGRKTRRR